MPHATAALARTAAYRTTPTSRHRLSWPAAMLAIGGLSAGLWLGIIWLVIALF